MPRIKVFWECLGNFWFSSIVDWIRKHVHTKLLSPLFVDHTGNTSLLRVVLCYHRRCKLLRSLLAYYEGKCHWFPVVHIQRSCRATAVVMIVKFVCFQDYEEWREGAYARDELNTWANAPSPLLWKSSMQKGGGGVFLGAYGTLLLRPCTNHFHLSMKHIHIVIILCWYQKGILWPWVGYPSCRHTTVASLFPQESSHTVPHSLFIQISTLPSFGMLPPASRNWPDVHKTAHDMSETLFIEHQRSLYIWLVTVGSIVDKCHVWKIYGS